jgi:hypothetical protein
VSAAATPRILRIMPREMRMMSERILSQTGMPAGFVLAITDLPMYSQVMGLGGLAHLLARFERLKVADPGNIAIADETDDGMTVDCGGEHAWVAIPSLIDLMREQVARTGTASLAITRAGDAAELALAGGFGKRFGLAVSYREHASPTLEASPLAGDRHQDPVLRDALENGAFVPEDLWWRFYDLAKKALATDTVVSRRHAGPVMVTEDGKVVGRLDNDDDTDIEFLMNPQAGGD